MHIVEGSVNVSQWLSMRNELVHLQLAVHIVGHEIWELCPSLDTSERATLPYTACDKLESWRKYISYEPHAYQGVHPRLVEISCPAAATPMIMLWPHPLWQASSAARMTPTLPVQSKV